jgi:hypothetical protein
MAVPISNVVRRIVFAPSGTGPYAFTFEILVATDIEVYKGDTLLTLTTDYTVTINPNGTGEVTLVATAGTDNITIVGARTIQRTTDFVTGGDLFANSLNTELDSLTIFAQQNSEGIDRSLRAPETDPTTIDMVLPRAADRAGKFLSFDNNGNPVPGAVPPELASVNAIAAEITAVAAIDTEVAAVAGNATNINTVAGISSNVTTVAGVASNVTTVAGISADVTAVAGDATDIGAVAAIVSDVTTVAGIAADVTAVAGVDSADLAAVAAIDSDVTTVGGIAADVTTVAGISADVTTVAGDATDIGTVAGIAANVTTVAGISADVTTVAADGTDIGTVAGLSTEITALGPIAADITTVAGIDSDVTAVAADATDIGTVAGSIANVNTVAGIDADVTTVAGISADVTAVAGDATDIGTVAGIAANVTTVAGIAANVTTVAGISSDVTTVAGDSADIQLLADNIGSIASKANAGANSDITSLSGLTTPLSVAQGGTGASTLTAENVILGDGTSAVKFVAPGSSGNVLTSNGTTWTSAAPTGGAGDKIEEGNSKVEVIDAGTGYVLIEVDGAEVARFNPDQLVTKAGTASVPAISTTGDTNTGIFFPAADTIAFAEGGAEAMRIDSSGNVGIGTTSPSTNLNVYNATSAFISVDGDNATQFRASRYSTDTGSAAFAFRKARGTLASPSAVASADSVGFVNFTAYGGANFRNVAQIQGAVETYTSDTNIAGALIFSTNSSSTTSTEKMRIDSSGNVGIGTSTPGNPLTVRTSGTSTSAGANIAARIESNGSGYAATLQFSDNVANSSYISMVGSATAFGQAGTEQMRITSGGLLQFNSGYGSVATAYGCRAWVNFDGTTNVGGNCTIRASGNVSSITDNGTGDYDVNFTTAMPDANYCTVATAGDVGGRPTIELSGASYATDYTTALVQLDIVNASNTRIDPVVVNVVVFR